MKRRAAARRHRLSVIVIAALAGLALVLLVVVAPMVEHLYQDQGLRPSWAAQVIIRVSRSTSNHLLPVVLLTAVLIGLLWTSFGQLDRPRGEAEE